MCSAVHAVKETIFLFFAAAAAAVSSIVYSHVTSFSHITHSDARDHNHTLSVTFLNDIEQAVG